MSTPQKRYLYICKACCVEQGRNFYPSDVNEVGRKSCYFCGNNSDWRLDSISATVVEDNNDSL